MRHIINGKDIQEFFGKSRSTSYKILSKVRKNLNKDIKLPITISEFCKYYKFEEMELQNFIMEKDNLEQQKKEKNIKHAVQEDLQLNPSKKSYIFAKN